MPTVLRIGGYRFDDFSHEPDEPPHVHVDHGDFSAKVWLEPIALAGNLGFRSNELTRILAMVREHQPTFLEAWHGYFSHRR